MEAVSGYEDMRATRREGAAGDGVEEKNHRRRMAMASFAHGATLLPSSPTASTSGNFVSGIWSFRKTVECKKITGRQQSRCRSWRMKKVVASSSSLPPEALFFDCDGVLVDTERDGHRISFNQAFEEKGLDVSWDVDLYGELLKIGGGKERMTHFFNKVGWPPVVLQQDAKERAAFVAGLHRRKTELFMELIETGALPLRPGVSRLVDEALSNGVKVAVCSTSNEKAVSAIVRVMLGSERASSIQIFAGDVVPRKKPDPAIYQLAASTLSVEPARCVVVEDSGIGLTAAKAAGMVCIVTKSGYTEHEDFSLADAVFACIGDPPTQNFDLTFCRHLLLQEGKTV